MSDDKIEILDRIEWALETKREQLMFGLDPLNAALARERRLFAVLLDCKEEIQQKDKVIEILKSACEWCLQNSDKQVHIENHVETALQQIEDLTQKEKE